MDEINFPYIASVFVITFASMVLHELAHGLVALWQGDRTAKESGRLSLNPLKHIDPVMTLIVPVFLAIMQMPVFGGAKPVPINTRNLKHREWSFALVALAGPLTNFLLAFIFAGLYFFIPVSAGSFWALFLSTGVSVNLGFMLFNLIPIPPLDGSRVLFALAPESVKRYMMALEQYGFIVVYILILIGGTLLGRYMLFASNGILQFFNWFYGLFMH